MEKTVNRLSFWNGYGQIRKRDVKAFKADVLRALEYKGMMTFYQKMNGQESLPVREKETIERIFKKYGITKNIWGNDDYNSEIDRARVAGC